MLGNMSPHDATPSTRPTPCQCHTTGSTQPHRLTWPWQQRVDGSVFCLPRSSVLIVRVDVRLDASVANRCKCAYRMHMIIRPPLSTEYDRSRNIPKHFSKQRSIFAVHITRSYLFTQTNIQTLTKEPRSSNTYFFSSRARFWKPAMRMFLYSSRDLRKAFSLMPFSLR